MPNVSSFSPEHPGNNRYFTSYRIEIIGDFKPNQCHFLIVDGVTAIKISLIEFLILFILACHSLTRAKLDTPVAVKGGGPFLRTARILEGIEKLQAREPGLRDHPRHPHMGTIHEAFCTLRKRLAKARLKLELIESIAGTGYRISTRPQWIKITLCDDEEDDQSWGHWDLPDTAAGATPDKEEPRASQPSPHGNPQEDQAVSSDKREKQQQHPIHNNPESPRTEDTRVPQTVEPNLPTHPPDNDHLRPAPSTIHLIQEPSPAFTGTGSTEPSSASSPQGSPVEPLPLIIPPGVSALDWENRPLTILKPPDAATRPTPADVPLVEPVAGPSGDIRLLLATPHNRSARINGHPAPALALLSESDRFTFDGTCSFRVAVYHRPCFIPTPAKSVGLACLICGQPMGADDRALVCQCGAMLHAPADADASGPLACFQMASACPRCSRPIRRTPSYGEHSVLPAEQDEQH